MNFHGFQITGIIFDMDGVLMYSNEIHVKAYMEALEEYQLKGFRHSEIAGMRTDEVIRNIIRLNHVKVDEDLVRRVAARKSELARKSFAVHVPLLEGVDDLLSNLKESGLKIALATSASAGTMNSFVNALKEDPFDFKICGNEVEKSKPHPEIYHRAIAGIQKNPKDCLVIEDSINGIEAARDAGALLCAVEGTFPLEILTESKPHGILKNATELNHYLAKNS